ncbi:MAG: hypothetical protein RJB60_147 [Pseudomonadota bacterium]|jgi:hypothetical protein
MSFSQRSLLRLSSTALAATLLLACASQAATPAPNADGEVIPADEAAAIAAVSSSLKASVQAVQAKEGRAFRDAHRKAHGCVSAKFTVLGGLDNKLAVGLFAKPASYDAVIRYSNGSQTTDDTKGDARGMAVKILGVPGPKLLDDEPGASTQDFLLMNSNVFFVKNAKEYVSFQKAITGGAFALAGWLATHAFNEGATLLKIQGAKVTNPLNVRYFSPVPNKLGNQQMKVSATPCAGATFQGAATGPDLLRENLQATLNQQGACFDFAVQLRTDPAKMPIEDATVEWKESASPFVKVARIEIPSQQAEQGEACEVRSFTPWHSLAEHRPLGGIQRVRKTVYQDISVLRHQLNGQPRIEP